MADEEMVVGGWSLINDTTGEIRKVVVFDKNNRSEKWDKVYAKSLAMLLEITGDEKTMVLAFLIRNMDYENRIHETMKTISQGTGVSKTTVNITMQLLQKNNYIHKIRNGFWRFSPHVIVNGKGYVGTVVLQLWKDEGQID